MTIEGSPLEEGDRVDHKIFGFGTVNGAPTALVGPDMSSRSGVRDAGWSIPVQWDDPSQTADAVMHHALRKVASPNSRPFTFWNRPWQPLLQGMAFGRPSTMNHRKFSEYLIEYGRERLAAIALQLAQQHENLLSNNDYICESEMRNYQIAFGWTIVWRALDKDADLKTYYGKMCIRDNEVKRALNALNERRTELKKLNEDLGELIIEINGYIHDDSAFYKYGNESCLCLLLDKLKSYSSNDFNFLEEKNLILEVLSCLERLIFSHTDPSGFDTIWVKPKKITAFVMLFDLVTSKFSEIEKCIEETKKAERYFFQSDEKLKNYCQQADQWWVNITKQAPLMDSNFNAFQQIEGALNPNP